ncbi:GyrI-like domain-containing protein [Neobacillus sp. SM06]|uniref:GyrI-like domain-containing protein n=1 Tax=Neobacillus sp. SM06 TaxID=3422492 RepID=UPI003D28A53B
MEIRVIEKEAFQVVGIAWNGTYSELDKLPQLFTEMEFRADEVLYPTGEQVLINPFHCRETEITYYVTTPVEKIIDVPEGMVGFTIPKKSYVFGSHDGLPEEVENTYIQMFKWMEEYGYEQDHHALSLEIYPFGKRNNKKRDETIQFDIYLPVKRYREED